ncbi:hypothetical protein BaRGS_00010385, partial [Batillaria attramentaria]
EFVKKGLLTYASDGYWTDLNDLPFNVPSSSGQGTGVFMWGNDEYPDDSVVGNHWDKEPDNTQWEDCVFISTQGELSVEDCNNRHGYICQIRTDQSGNCPAGDWYGGPSGTMCYYFSNTTYWPNVITWDQSRKTCESWAPFVNDQTRKATMLAITNPDIQTYLASNLAYYEINNQRQVYWTGLNDKTTEATFVWAGNENTQFNQDYM